MESKADLEKVEQFEKNVARLRKQFEEMPVGVLLIVQGVLIEVVQKGMEQKEGVK